MSRADSRCQSTCALGRVNLGGCSAHTCVTWPGWGSHSRVYMKSPAPHLTGGVRSHSRPGRCRFSSHGAPGLRGGAGRRSVPGTAPYLAAGAPCPGLGRTDGWYRAGAAPAAEQGSGRGGRRCRCCPRAVGASGARSSWGSLRPPLPPHPYRILRVCGTGCGELHVAAGYHTAVKGRCNADPSQQ